MLQLLSGPERARAVSWVGGSMWQVSCGSFLLMTVLKTQLCSTLPFRLSSTRTIGLKKRLSRVGNSIVQNLSSSRPYSGPISRLSFSLQDSFSRMVLALSPRSTLSSGRSSRWLIAPSGRLQLKRLSCLREVRSTDLFSQLLVVGLTLPRAQPLPSRCSRVLRWLEPALLPFLAHSSANLLRQCLCMAAASWVAREAWGAWLPLRLSLLAGLACWGGRQEPLASWLLDMLSTSLQKMLLLLWLLLPSPPACDSPTTFRENRMLLLISFCRPTSLPRKASMLLWAQFWARRLISPPTSRGRGQFWVKQSRACSATSGSAKQMPLWPSLGPTTTIRQGYFLCCSIHPIWSSLSLSAWCSTLFRNDLIGLILAGLLPSNSASPCSVSLHFRSSSRLKLPNLLRGCGLSSSASRSLASGEWLGMNWLRTMLAIISWVLGSWGLASWSLDIWRKRKVSASMSWVRFRWEACRQACWMVLLSTWSPPCSDTLCSWLMQGYQINGDVIY